MTMQVAFFAPLLHTGGTQRHLQQVLGLLDHGRFTARVYTLRPGGEVEDELRVAGVPVRSLDVGGSLLGPRALVAMVRTARALRAARVQVVHGYQWRPALVGAVVARLAGVPLVVAGKRSLTGDDRRARLAWRLIGHQVDTIVTNAEALRDEAGAQGVTARWSVIPCGVDVDRFRGGPSPVEAKRAVGLDPQRPVIGTVGRLEVRKRQDHLLRAARAMTTAGEGALAPQVLIVGDGPLRPRLEAEARDSGVASSVRFTGSVADVRVPLAAMDVFVLPSAAEGMSNALLEAMAAGRPVVATAVGGSSEVIEDGRTGVLVPPDDVDRLADEIQALLSNPGRSAFLGAAARRAVTQRFGARAMVARLEDLYAERLAARQRRAA
jgi:glycosyltransferase involved in cell wall biosynthesis